MLRGLQSRPTEPNDLGHQQSQKWTVFPHVFSKHYLKKKKRCPRLLPKSYICISLRPVWYRQFGMMFDDSNSQLNISFIPSCPFDDVGGPVENMKSLNRWKWLHFKQRLEESKDIFLATPPSYNNLQHLKQTSCC